MAWLGGKDEGGDGVDVTHLVGKPLFGPDRAAVEEQAFVAYQDAFHKNCANPNLWTARDLVQAWNNFADVMGLDRI